ncbi:MAG: threonine--tRNA ligase [Magnetococcales bacterium]|nr:threonine--tRNA ligase [Magnetococcales bacterium]
MVTITLPDGSKKQFDKAITGFEFAESIGAGLAKAALAIVVDGKETDLSSTIENDAKVSILTARQPEGLEVLRPSTAHILAQAVKEIYPKAQITIGPVIEHGFYYDVSFPKPISSDDLEKIEKRMHDIVDEDLEVTRHVWDRNDAIKYFKDIGEDYKAEIISDLPETETISLYRQGDEKTGFMDLCRGPHLPSTKKAGHGFKLLKLAGAYWRGNSDNEMLTRIYGTAWENEKELKKYLVRLEEAEKRDHRKLGKELDLFHLQEDAPGQIFWHHKGWHIFRKLQEYIRDQLLSTGYEEVNTPQLINSDMYKKSGHWDKFGTENMFIVKDEEKNRMFAMKPMNCPCHVQIFNTGNKSYRDLPLRMSEFGTCMRNEAHGALHGLMRVTSMTQDDAHIFCTPEQIESEVVVLCELIKSIYKDFGFDDIFVKFSDRPEMRVGSDDVWDNAEQALRNACAAANLEGVLNPGEGAFYGPKLEFVLRDAIGRDWQCGTVQLDFNLPVRLDATYTDTEGNKQHPIMIHRALLGSLERFTGILIENFEGHFPLWLAPMQVVATGITNSQNPEVEKFVAELRKAGLEASSDLRNEKVSYKIREHSHQKVPYIAVLGDKEIASGNVTYRRLGSQAQTTVSQAEFIAMLQQEIATKALPPQGKQANAA